MDPSLRPPVVAGQFYEGSEAALIREIEEAYRCSRGPGALPEVAADGPRHLLGLVSPHAGYFYSAPIAAFGFAALARDGRPAGIIIIGPKPPPWGLQTNIEQSSAITEHRTNSNIGRKDFSNSSGERSSSMMAFKFLPEGWKEFKKAFFLPIDTP